LQWAQNLGAKASFGTQAAICFAAFWLVVSVQIWGRFVHSVLFINMRRKWRERFPPPSVTKNY
jgi:hypothetical protein